MKKIAMIAAVALVAGMTQAASVIWSSGTILNPNTGLAIGATTGIYLATVYFYSDAAGTTLIAPSAGTGAQISDGITTATSTFAGTTANVFTGGAVSGYYAQMVIASTDGEWIRSSGIRQLGTIPTLGNLTLNFGSGLGFVGGTTGGTTWPTTDDYGWEPVPEPTSIALLVLGVTAIGLRRRVRKA